MKIIDNDNTTDTQVTSDLKTGRYILTLQGATATTAVVSVYRRPKGVTDTSQDMPVVKDGTAVTLTKDDPAKEIHVGSEEIAVDRATGSDAITVTLVSLGK